MKTARVPDPRREAKTIRARAGRAIVQLLFTKPTGYSVERLRQLLREAFVECPNPEERAVASLDTFQILEAVIETNEALHPLGLQIELSSGFARLATSRVQPEKLAAIIGSDPAQQAAGTEGQSISQSTLEVLAAIAIKQPLTHAQLILWFDADKRGQIERLLELGLVERLKQPDGRVAYATTAEFLRKFQLKDASEIGRLVGEGEG